MDQCPTCRSTDVADIVRSDKRVCLDCDFVWLPGARRKINKKYNIGCNHIEPCMCHYHP